jgi:hypothetical protein
MVPMALITWIVQSNIRRKQPQMYEYFTLLIVGGFIVWFFPGDI